jgi:hypothetical protein
MLESHADADADAVDGCNAGERLSLPPRPPYLDPRTRGPVVLKGVNYASGSSGLLRATGFNFVRNPKKWNPKK